MKKIIRRFVEVIGLVMSYLWPLSFSKGILAFRDSFYTGYISRHFNHFGNSLFIWKALNIMGERFIYIDDGCVFEADLQLTARQTESHEPQIRIGHNCLFRRGAHITAINNITIGNNLLTGTNVLITDNAHGLSTTESLNLPPRQRPLSSSGPVVIGNNVWLGNNVCVLPGVTIGDGAIVGANSVVTHDIPPFTVAAGIPAHIIKSVH